MTGTFVSTARDAFRFITFRSTKDEMLSWDRRHLIFGLVSTWIVGMGRWWDDPDANILQHLGLGSLIYVFVLALVLLLVALPLKPNSVTYRHVLTFVALTSPPAILYAIPVERYTELSTAESLNVWFLAIVAIWRLALLFFYFHRFARLNLLEKLVTAMLPITGIIVALTYLNLERAVFNVMGGLRGDQTANDGAYSILILLTVISVIQFPVVLGVYILLVVLKRSMPIDISSSEEEETDKD